MVALATGEEEINQERLEETPSGFKMIRWSVGLGEQLARNQVPFMARALRIESLQGALHASSIMLVLWRSTPGAATATTKEGLTALHLAARHQVCSFLLQRKDMITETRYILHQSLHVSWE